jgi:hypothetical protein
VDFAAEKVFDGFRRNGAAAKAGEIIGFYE